MDGKGGGAVHVADHILQHHELSRCLVDAVSRRKHAMPVTHWHEIWNGGQQPHGGRPELHLAALHELHQRAVRRLKERCGVASDLKEEHVRKNVGGGLVAVTWKPYG